MKKLLFLFALIASMGSASAQCVTKCINSSASASVGSDPTWTYQWTVSGGLTFTGQGTNAINIASVGSVIGTYTISCLITSPYCDSTVVGDICVIQTAPTHIDEIVCASNGNILFSDGVPSGGTITNSLGVVVTGATSADIGQQFTYTAASGGCSGSVNFTLNSSPVPNTTITIN